MLGVEREEDVCSCMPGQRLFAPQIPEDTDLAIQPVPQPPQLRVTARTSLHSQRGAQTPAEVGRRLAGAPRRSSTLPFPADWGVKLRKMSSRGEKNNKSHSGMR